MQKNFFRTNKTFNNNRKVLLEVNDGEQIVWLDNNHNGTGNAKGAARLPYLLVMRAY